MLNGVYKDLLSKREVLMAFNKGLETAIYILEIAEDLSLEEKKSLVEELKQKIKDSEADYTLKLIRSTLEANQKFIPEIIPKIKSGS